MQRLNERFGQHRRKFYHVVRDPSVIASGIHKEDDEYSPGVHLVEEHSVSEYSAFNDIFRVFIVDVCSPKTLEVREHKHIHELKTLKPFGINTVSPFSIPQLHL